MLDIVHIRRLDDDLVVIGPDGAPTVLDGVPAIDTLVLEVLGGHLSWGLLGDQRLPAAVLDDAEQAQEWIWAVFGEAVALAVDEGSTGEFPAAPALPELVANAWRLGYAHWASRWWPASIIEAIAPLDDRLLLDEIAALAEECEMLIDGADAPLWVDERQLAPEALGRAEDYALAAGPSTTPPPGALVLARGTGGWDWRRCPPGLLDASERAVSWDVLRVAGTTTVQVRAVAAPQLRGEVPPHLHPHALIHTATGAVTATMELNGDTWRATVAAPEGAESALSVEVSVPGVGRNAVDIADPLAATEIATPDADSAVADDAESAASTGIQSPRAADEAELRRRVRELAAARLRRAAEAPGSTADLPLLAEIAAADSESDF
ncbi:hypothetical protein [Nocardia altamirensis]|uniref:hypothetical protein n=1 Tax=Nocardia altamirensis TaxID=472158 RepID=UPI0008407B6D|nr:hypothetical protein [Nocardia altamirensis]